MRRIAVLSSQTTRIGSGLNSAIAETGAEKVFVTHGYTDIFARWLKDQGYDAEVVPTEFTGETLDDGDAE